MSRRRQRGISLVVAIFLVSVVAALAAFAVTTTQATRNATNLQLISDRVMAAAQAGAELGAYRALNQGLCNTQILNNMQGALRGYRVVVDCVSSQPEGTYRVADITATATWGTYGTADYAYRQVVRRVDQP